MKQNLTKKPVIIRFFFFEILDKGVARDGPRVHPPIKMLFQIFKLNFSWAMSKVQYFRNKLSKIAEALLNRQYWWPKVPWFGQMVVFEAD